MTDEEAIEWAGILEQSRSQVEQWKARGEEARTALISHYKDNGVDSISDAEGNVRYKVVPYKTYKFDRDTLRKDWAALNQSLTTEGTGYRVEVIGTGDEE